MEIIFSKHALFEMKRRQITKKIVKDILKNPHQKISSKTGRIIIQGKYIDKNLKKEMLLRIIGKEKGNIFSVITLYKTSKIEKYWIMEE